MHKIAVYILSFTILFQSFNFEWDDYAKIPTLVNHIMCHTENGDNLSDFISMHYGSMKNIHNGEHEEHQKLPFKHEHLEAHYQLDFIFYDTDNAVANLDENNFSNKNFSYKEPSTDLYINNFFQPPQV